MGNVYRSDHATDGDLLERIMAGETDPHLTRCARCAERAHTIAHALDPLPDEARQEPFDDLFYRRQAARISARIAAGEGRRVRPALQRLAWLGGAMAAGVALGVALHERAPVMLGGSPSGHLRTVLAQGFQSAQDLADDRLLREIDETLDEDPYDFAPTDG